MRRPQALVIACLWMGSLGPGATDARAIDIALEPSTQTVEVGASFDVALTVSGLTAGAAPSLGVYDVDVLFDASVFAFEGVSFGDPVLGDQLAIVFPSTSTTTPIAGGVKLFELSLDSPGDLTALQAALFTLATLRFEAVEVGTSTLTPSLVVVGDELGDPLLIDEALGASVSSVPEPGSALLLALGALVLGRSARACRWKCSSGTE